MSYNTKNYTEQGGEVTHFGGKVIFEDGCQIDGLPKGEAVPDAAGEAPTSEEFNALLASLRAAGIIEST